MAPEGWHTWSVRAYLFTVCDERIHACSGGDTHTQKTWLCRLCVGGGRRHAQGARAHRGRIANDCVPHDHLVEHVGFRLVLGGDVHEELLHVPVPHGAQVGVDAEREDRLPRGVRREVCARSEAEGLCRKVLMVRPPGRAPRRRSFAGGPSPASAQSEVTTRASTPYQRPRRRGIPGRTERSRRWRSAAARS